MLAAARGPAAPRPWDAARPGRRGAGSGGGSTFAAGGDAPRLRRVRVQQTQKGGKLTTTSYLLPLLYRVPAGRPATPAQGSALALGFISESSGILASSHKAEGQPSQASSRGVEALRASGPSSWAPGATTGRRTVQRDDGLDGGQRGGAAGSGQPAPRGAGVAAAALAAAALAVGLCQGAGSARPRGAVRPRPVARGAAVGARGPRRAERARAGAACLTPLAHGGLLAPRAGPGWAIFCVWLFASATGRALAWLGLPPLAGQLLAARSRGTRARSAARPDGTRTRRRSARRGSARS